MRRTMVAVHELPMASCFAHQEREELRPHSLALLFPPPDAATFDALVADIREHGVRLPITVHEAQILDGVTRHRAAQAAGADCPLVPFTGHDPVAFVVSANLHRRHLSTVQRAEIAAKLANLKPGRPSSRTPPTGGISVKTAATMLNVPLRTVERTIQRLRMTAERPPQHPRTPVAKKRFDPMAFAIREGDPAAVARALLESSLAREHPMRLAATLRKVVAELEHRALSG